MKAETVEERSRTSAARDVELVELYMVNLLFYFGNRERERERGEGRPVEGPLGREMYGAEA